METMVTIIETVKKNIVELEERKKENEKRKEELNKQFANLEEDNENINSNLLMFRKVLSDLLRTKEEEIQAVMTETKIEKKTSGKRTTKKVPIALLDENRNKIAEYDSRCSAAKDLGINSNTVLYRTGIPEDNQLKKFGYILREEK